MDKAKKFQEEYKKLDAEAGKYNRPEFDEVYKIIAELVSGEDNVGDNGNLGFPLVEGSVIDEALEKAGFADDKEFVQDFKKYREIEQKARDLQFEAITEALRTERENDTPIDEALQKEGFVKNKELQNLLDKIINEAKAKNPHFPYPKPFEHLRKEDAELDELFMLDNVAYKCSGLAPYYRELEKYNIFPLLNKLGGVRPLFELLNKICTFIKESSDKPIDVRNKITELVQAFDNYRGAGLIWQMLILQGLIKWFEGVDIDESDNNLKEAQALYEWVGKRLIEAFAVYTYYPFGENDREELLFLSEYLYSTELGIIITNHLNKNNEVNRATGKLTLEDVALLHFYLDEWITENNAKDIAERYGHKSEKKLLAHFTKNSARVNRLSKPDTEIRMRNKIKRFEKIFNYLPEEKKEKITQELKILQDAYETGDY